MKKNLLKLIGSLFFTAFLITGCQKETQLNEETPVADGNSLQAKTNGDDKSGCQLKHVDYGSVGGFTLDFKYNNKGLASEVLISYYDGYFERHEIYYDRKSRLVKTRISSSDPGVIVYDFSYSGDFITRGKSYFEGTNEPWRDIRYSYNSKGQMINWDDVVQDVHVKYFYNNQGYNSHSELYYGSDLYLTTDLAFKIPNRNPFLAVNGLNFGFWDVFLPLWDKRWESSDRWVVYDEGTPTVILDTDPAQTTMVTGSQNYLTSAIKYDMISESFYTESMTYKNCGGGHDDDASVTAKPGKSLSPVALLKRILNSPSKNMKQKLTEFKRQYIKN